MAHDYRPGDAVQARYDLGGGLFFAAVAAGTVGIITRIDGDRITARFEVNGTTTTVAAEPWQLR
jgi:hypothetical protein